MATIPRRYVYFGSGLLLMVGAVIGIVFTLTTHLADAHEDMITEKEAYEAALAVAQTDGLDAPVNYSIQRMTLGQWGTAIGAGFNPEVVDVEQGLWVVAFTGSVTLNKPGSSGFDATPEAGFNDFDYYAIALDAATGKSVSTSARYPGKDRPVEATRPVPTGEYVETGAIERTPASTPTIPPGTTQPTPRPTPGPSVLHGLPTHSPGFPLPSTATPAVSASSGSIPPDEHGLPLPATAGSVPEEGATDSDDSADIALMKGITVEEAERLYGWQADFSVVLASILDGFPADYATSEFRDDGTAMVGFAGAVPPAAQAMLDAFSADQGVAIEVQGNLGYSQAQIKGALRSVHGAVTDSPGVKEALTAVSDGEIVAEVHYEGTPSDEALATIEERADAALRGHPSGITAKVSFWSGDDDSMFQRDNQVVQHVGGEPLTTCTAAFTVRPQTGGGAESADHGHPHRWALLRQPE